MHAAPGARRRRLRLQSAVGAALALGSCTGCVDWALPDRMLAGAEGSGGVGDALGEAVRRVDAEPLSAHVKRIPGARVCFVREFDSLRYPALRNYWRSYGLPNLQVPDAHWAIAVLRARRPPEFAVVRTQTLILAETPDCADAERLRLKLEDRWSGRPFLLSVSAEP